MLRDRTAKLSSGCGNGDLEKWLAFGSWVNLTPKPQRRFILILQKWFRVVMVLVGEKLRILINCHYWNEEFCA